MAPPQKHNALPFVVFLDIDRTLIGRANQMAGRFWLHALVQELEQARELPEGTSRELPPPAELMTDDLLRPGAAEALRRMRSELQRLEGRDSLELFVCTLGVKRLVAEAKVPGIERLCPGVRLNRPLFCASTDARDNCKAADGKHKLVRACFDLALDALSKRAAYIGALRAGGAREHVFRTRFLMVDDTPDIALDAASNAHLVVCPPFDYLPRATDTSVKKVLAMLPAAAREHPRVAAFVMELVATRTAEGEASAKREDDGFWRRFALGFSRACEKSRKSGLARIDEH